MIQKTLRQCHIDDPMQYTHITASETPKTVSKQHEQVITNEKSAIYFTAKS